MDKKRLSELNYYTTFTAAKKLWVKPATIRKWVNSGYIKAHKTLGGHRRIPAEEVYRVLNENEKGDK